MPKAYRNVILALCGIALGALLMCGSYRLYEAGQQHQPGYHYQPAANSKSALTGQRKALARPYEPNCQNPQSNGDSDLCSQWAAVDQAAEANRLSSLNLRFALFSLFFSICGTGLLVWTLMETRRTSRRELRAYIFPENVGAFQIKEGDTVTDVVGSGLLLRNSGQTPAYKVRHWGEVKIWDVADEDSLPLSRSFAGFENPVPPNGTFHKGRNTGGPLSEEEIAALKSGIKAIYVYGRVEYIDAFAKPRFTTYRFMWSGWPIPVDMMMNFAIRGNEAN